MPNLTRRASTRDDGAAASSAGHSTGSDAQGDRRDAPGDSSPWPAGLCSGQLPGSGKRHPGPDGLLFQGSPSLSLADPSRLRSS